MFEPEQLKFKFSSLITELKAAKLYFSFYQKFTKAQTNNDLLNSHGFWDHTITCYALSTFLCLCHVFDTYSGNKRSCWIALWMRKLFELLKEIFGFKKVESEDNKKMPEAIHLLKYVKDIKTIPGVKLNDVGIAKLKSDLKFLRQDKKVLKLRKWRNNVICHRNQELLFNGKDNFFKENGFDEKEINELIESGFLILKNWASIYESDFDKRIIEIHRANAQEEADIPIILAAMRSFREKQRQV